jgi:hypothetical protein
VNPSTLTIKLTGSGTFEPDDGEEVTGGGTWETFSGTSSTGNGSYEVRKLVSWQFANLQTGTFIDLIDDGARANGNAVLRIRYSDGSQGVLGIGSHGPGARSSVMSEGNLITVGREIPRYPHGINENVVDMTGMLLYKLNNLPGSRLPRSVCRPDTSRPWRLLCEWVPSLIPAVSPVRFSLLSY